MKRRRASLLLRLWLLSLSTFLATALVSILVPDLFFRSPVEEIHARELALHVELLEGLLDDPPRLAHAVSRLHEQAGLDLEILAGDERVAAVGQLPVDGGRRLVLRGPAHGRPEIVAHFAASHPSHPVPVDPRHLSASLTIVILGGLVHALLLRRLVMRPLSRLAAAAETFDAGNLDARVGLTGNDELADVARAFDDMAGRIEGFVAAQRELLANVSHELRTPLARIRVVLDTVEATGDMTLVAELHDEVDELQGLVETLLEAVSLDVDDGRAGLLRGGMAAVDPIELLELAAHRFERAHPGRALARAWPDVLPCLWANFEGLARALDNVLDNAAKYSPRDSEIRLTAGVGPEELEIVVADRGMGIAAPDLPHVLEPFFRAERSRSRQAGGAGLGLAIVARVVHRHRGRLEIQSTPQPPEGTPSSSHGTTVRMRLPLARPAG